MRFSRSSIGFRKTILLFVITRLFACEVSMEGGQTTCLHAEIVPAQSLRLSWILSTSSWANSGVEEARLRPSCCKFVLLAGDVKKFELLWYLNFS